MLLSPFLPFKIILDVKADGQIKTARDVAIACLLGAEEFGIATGALVTLGCIMLRKCHLNTCSVGIATQDPELRAQFSGQPQHLINYFYFIAEDLRKIMASLGFRTINEMVGRVDMLHTDQAIDHWKATGLDLSALLAKPVPAGVGTYHSEDQDHGLETVLDNELVAQSESALKDQSPVEIHLPIRNSNRTVGTILSSEIAKRYGENALPTDTIQCNFRGSAGQSFGAFLAKGVTFRLEGDANDYFGKGISGGKLIVFPDRTSTFAAEENVITGNVNMYGATGGEAYIRGIAGERFCVRNSGVTAVVEGIGDHGCEYMTGGTVVILGDTGRNFAAGMSGGLAFVFDQKGEFRDQCNLDMVNLFQVEDHKDLSQLQALIKNHLEYTGSATAKYILDEWKELSGKFVKVFPKDYQRVLEENAKKQGTVTAGG